METSAIGGVVGAEWVVVGDRVEERARRMGEGSMVWMGE